MGPANAMIVRGQVLPAPPATLQRFFGGDSPETGRQLQVAGLNVVVALHPESSPFLTVGRSADCDIRLPHEDVSYRHAHLQLVAGHIYCIDLASRTGTFWDGVSLPSGWLMPGQSIRIGPYSITACGCPADETDRRVTRLNLLAHEVVDAQIELEFLNGHHLSSGKTLWPLRQPITLIGSSPQCRLRLKDGSVSRVHCSLMATPSGVLVTDLLGRGGTKINGDPVTFQLLHHNDELGVGRFRFGIRYRNEDVAEDAASPFQPFQSSATAPPPESHPRLSGGNSSVSEEFVISMMDRFMEMQQQMSAINHQQMMFMAQMLGSMHQNHHDLVQRELAHIAQLGAEIKKLQIQAAQQADSAATELLPHSDADGSVTGPQPTRQKLESAAAVPIPDGSTMHAFREEIPPPVGPATPERPHQPRYTARDVSSHSRLIERMAALEKERNSRWRKLVGILTGSDP